MTLPWERTAPVLTPAERDEWAGLLDGAELSTAGDGLVLHGEGLDVVIGLWPSEDKPGCVDAHVTAFRPGRQRVRLNAVTLSARSDDDPVDQVCEHTTRGDLVLRGLTEGRTYRLGTVGGDTPAGSVAVPSPRRVTAGRSAEPVHLPTFAFKADPGEAARSPWDLPAYPSEDGTVVGTVRPLGPDPRAGRAEIAFETRDPARAGAAVRFSLVENSSGEVVLTGEVGLDPRGEGVWEGHWEGEVRLPAPAALVFEVLLAHTS